MMLVDSHCHLDFPELVQNLDSIKTTMQTHGVSHALCISVTLDKFPEVLAIAKRQTNLFASVGVHPDYENIDEPTVDQLVELAKDEKIVAIGETGLDYYRLTGDLSWQRQRFRTHIQAAVQAGKPLVIHTRNAAEDTLRIMQEEGADRVGGVMHCFTENIEVAHRAMEMGFFISFSGIITFKNATALKEVVRQVPLERILVETDSPYLAPVPYRGKINQPAYVKYVAEEIAHLHGVPLSRVCEQTTQNFFTLFKHAKQ